VNIDYHRQRRGVTFVSLAALGGCQICRPHVSGDVGQPAFSRVAQCISFIKRWSQAQFGCGELHFMHGTLRSDHGI